MTEQLTDRIGHFVRRTHLARYLTLYFSAAFVVLQLVDMFASRLRLPDAVFAASVLLLAAGLPVLLAVVLVRGRAAAHKFPTARAPHPHSGLTWRGVAVSIVALMAVWGLVAAGWLLVGAPEGSNTKTVTGQLRVVAEGEDVTVTVRRVIPGDSFAGQPQQELEPGDEHELATGEYLLQLRRPGYNDLQLLTVVTAEAVRRVTVHWVQANSPTRNMVFVAARAGVPAFLIDRFEVTNAEYLEFVKAGGYRAASLAKFVDRSGSPGPRLWSGGIYPEGTGDLPVVGVSWQEAGAYARWRGKQLPTWEQWWHAALRAKEPLPWGSAPDSTGVRANFRLSGAAPVGTHLLGISHAGAHDMAGNVREWLRTARISPDKRVAVGGSWQDPAYVFDPEWIEEFPGDFASELIGFRCVLELKGVP